MQGEDAIGLGQDPLATEVTLQLWKAQLPKLRGAAGELASSVVANIIYGARMNGSSVYEKTVECLRDTESAPGLVVELCQLLGSHGHGV
jgi:hypothetical protein